METGAIVDETIFEVFGKLKREVLTLAEKDRANECLGGRVASLDVYEQIQEL